MNTISISQLKINPSNAINLATDYPMAINNKGQITAYLIGNELFNKIVTYLEDLTDKKTVKETDFKKGKNFDKLASELSI